MSDKNKVTIRVLCIIVAVLISVACTFGFVSCLKSCSNSEIANAADTGVASTDINKYVLSVNFSAVNKDDDEEIISFYSYCLTYELFNDPNHFFGSVTSTLDDGPEVITELRSGNVAWIWAGYTWVDFHSGDFAVSGSFRSSSVFTIKPEWKGEQFTHYTLSYYDDPYEYTRYVIVSVYSNDMLCLTIRLCEFIIEQSIENYIYISDDIFVFSLSDSYNAYITGKQEGYDLAKEEWYSKGIDEGKIAGYNQYVEEHYDPNAYTFQNLMDSILFAPLKAMYSLLNFNFLGVNIFGFVTFLATAIVLILILIKLFSR